MSDAGGVDEDGGTRIICAVLDKAGWAHEDVGDHPIWGYREVQESFRAATGGHSQLRSVGWLH